jgi:hypothetical protein
MKSRATELVRRIHQRADSRRGHASDVASRET